MEPIEVKVEYYVNKAGLYVEFSMDCTASELSEMNSWSKYLMGTVKKEFKELFKEYGMDFSTESAYVVQNGDGFRLIACLLRSDYDDALIRHLESRGICKGE